MEGIFLFDPPLLFNRISVRLVVPLTATLAVLHASEQALLQLVLDELTQQHNLKSPLELTVVAVSNIPLLIPLSSIPL